LGRLVLLQKGNQLETNIPIIAPNSQITGVAFGLLVVAILLIHSAINLIKNKKKINWNFCWFSILLFFLGGLANGYLLFGQPLDRGQRINLIVIVLTGIFLVLGKPALNSQNQE